MINFVIGRPGDGKTLYSVHVLVKRLVYSNCAVITNIKLDLERLNEYIQQRYTDADVDVLERVKIIDGEDVSHFYRFRSGGLVLDKVNEEGPNGKKIDRLEFL